MGVAFQSYVGVNARPKRGEHHVLAGGDAPVDPAFLVVPRPKAEMTAEGRAFRASANAALSDVLYHGATERRSYCHRPRRSATSTWVTTPPSTAISSTSPKGVHDSRRSMTWASHMDSCKLSPTPALVGAG